MRATLHVVAVLATLLTTSASYGAPQERSSGIESISSLITVSKQAREAYFDGMAQLRVRSFISVHRHSGLSFRTCEPGRLFEQRFETGDSIELQVDHEGLIFIAKVQQRKLEARLNARLLDNTWHNVNMFFRLGNFTLSAAGHAEVVANATYNSEILALPDENDANVTLIVGDGFRGCILQGPGILFNDSINSNALLGACPLDTGICGVMMLQPTTQPTAVQLGQPSSGGQIDYCQHSPCMTRGKCVSRQDHYQCQCYARYSGKNCQTDHGRDSF